jgi:hypothetical protein
MPFSNPRLLPLEIAIPEMRFSLAMLAIICCYSSAIGQEIRVPAFTGYPSPLANNADSARVSERRGITRWRDPSQVIRWYGKFEVTGEVSAAVELSLPEGHSSSLRLRIGNQTRDALAKATGNGIAIADFGVFQIANVGYQAIELQSLNSPEVPAGDIQTLVLRGAACHDAHFNLKERRNAASVHLRYPVPQVTNVEAFYSEVTAIEDPVWTFYMACGWHRGYFGMQVNSPTERRIIFSVWDSGDEAVDRSKVDQENRVQLVGKGEGVYSGDFGNEGTGGHSHLKVQWKTGVPQKFVVLAKPVDKKSTVFAGYWFHPDKDDWMLISAWKAPKEGGWLRGLHGFSENFVGENGNLLRKALYGNQWARMSDGKWLELNNAIFSHDPTGKSDRLDRYMGTENGQFFLSHGGYIDGFTKSGDQFSRAPLGIPPNIESIRLPE